MLITLVLKYNQVLYLFPFNMDRHTIQIEIFAMQNAKDASFSMKPMVTIH